MIDEAVKLGTELDGDSLIIYVLMLGQLGIIIFLLKSYAKELHENSKHLSAISEQLRSLIQAAIGRRND